MASTITLYTFGNMVDADIDSATSSATGYPKENLIDNNPDTSWKATDTADNTLKFDLNAAYAVTCVFLFIRNYASITDSEIYNLYYSDNGDDVTPTWTFVSGSPSIADKTSPIHIRTITSATHRWWSISTALITTTPEISMVAFGKTNSITIGNQWPEDDTDEFANKTIKGDDGRHAVIGLNSRSYLEFSRKFLINGDTNYTALRAAHQDSYGSRLPLIYYDGTTYRLVKFADDSFKKNQLDYQLYNPTVKFAEMPYRPAGKAF